MLKLLLLVVIFFYALYRFGGLILKVLSFGSSPQQNNKRGNVNVDSNPNKDKKHFDGGEYVDYEEVK